MAWPASALPAGTDPATLRWRLHWSADGGLAVDAEAVTGGSVATLTRDPAGLPASLVAQHPELKGAVALRLDKKTAKQLTEILKGQVAVAMYDSTGKLLDATGAQTAIALDSLYAAKAASRSYGVSFSGGKVGFTLWAPTAQSVALLTWPAGSADQPRECCPARADDAGRRRVVVDVGVLGQERPLPLRGEGLRTEHRQGRDEPRHRPEFGCADAELDKVSGRRPQRHGIHALGVAQRRRRRRSRRTSTRRSTSCTSATTR